MNDQPNVTEYTICILTAHRLHTNQLFRTCSQADPRNVMLVHGEAAKMEFLKQKIMQEFGINCMMPANGETVTVATPPSIPVDMSRLLFKRTLEQCYCRLTS